MTTLSLNPEISFHIINTNEQHSVQPDNGLRFALTARYIETSDKADLEKGSFRLDQHQVYDGH